MADSAYDALTSELARAEYEESLRVAHGWTKQRAADTLAARLGVSSAAIERRRKLMRAGAAAKELWARIDAGTLSLSTALKTLQRATNIAAATGRTLRVCVDEELAGSHPGQRKAEPSGAEAPTEHLDVRRFWSSVGSTFEKSARIMLHGVTEEQVQVELRRLRQELAAVLASTSVRWKALGSKKAAAAPSEARRQYLSGCRVLRVDPMTPRQERDPAAARAFLVKVKRVYKTLFVARHHPDIGGDPKLLQEATGAMTAVETYLELYCGTAAGKGTS